MGNRRLRFIVILLVSLFRFGFRDDRKTGDGSMPYQPPYPTIAGIIATHKIKHENRALRDSHVLEDADRFRCCYTKRTRMKKGANNGIFKETNYKYILNQLHSATSGPASSFR